MNRVWQHLFGVGLVSTVDNFGTTGDQPSNPALLDYLAQTFHPKRMVDQKAGEADRSYASLPARHRVSGRLPRHRSCRTISSGGTLPGVWRPRRFATASWPRPAELDLKHPAGSPSMALRMIEIRDDGPVVRSILEAADRSRYRSVYLPLLRGETPRPLAAFDPVAQTLVTGQREATTVPPQALFMLNSPFVRRQSLVLAESLLTNSIAMTPIGSAKPMNGCSGRDPRAAGDSKIRTFLTHGTRPPGVSRIRLPPPPVRRASQL